MNKLDKRSIFEDLTEGEKRRLRFGFAVGLFIGLAIAAALSQMI